MVDLAIITGMSGAGRTEAMHTFEDLGYFCIDNLPPALLVSLVNSENLPSQQDGTKKMAVVCDARNYHAFKEIKQELAKLRDADIDYRILFLDASDERLMARYKASRRRHPLSVNTSRTISQSISYERELLTELREIANYVIDTTDLKPIALREQIRELFSETTPAEGLSVVVYSFGFKHGAALDADIVIDVRFLPNPYYDPEMRHLTGLDEKVRNFVIDHAQTQEFLGHWKDLLECVMRGYVAEGKQQLAIAVGCTGGQHRSVAIAEATGTYLSDLGYRVHVDHRDLSRAETTKREGA